MAANPTIANAASSPDAQQVSEPKPITLRQRIEAVLREIFEGNQAGLHTRLVQLLRFGEGCPRPESMPEGWRPTPVINNHRMLKHNGVHYEFNQIRASLPKVSKPPGWLAIGTQERRIPMKPFIGAFTLALLLLASALPAASQGKPYMEILPFNPFVAPAAVNGCGFDMLVSPQAGKPNHEKLILFTNSSLVVGPLFATIENLSTHKTIDVNISGPGTFTFSDMTFVGYGPSLQILPENVATAAGLPVSALLNGRFVFTFDDQGNITSATYNGRAQDLCPLLQ